LHFGLAFGIILATVRTGRLDAAFELELYWTGSYRREPYYSTDFSNLTLSYTTGREVENVGPPTGIVTTDVRDVSLYGRHWLSRDWALTYDVHWHEQGDLYTRYGARIGLRRAF
jgi:YaiO family outer membrane protein